MDSLEIIKRVDEKLYEQLRIKTALDPHFKTYMERSITLEKLSKLTAMPANEAASKIEQSYQGSRQVEEGQATLMQSIKKFHHHEKTRTVHADKNALIRELRRKISEMKKLENQKK